LSGKESDTFTVEDLVFFDPAKDSDYIKDGGIGAGSVLRVKGQAGKGATFHGFAELTFNQGGHHKSHDVHMKIGYDTLVLFEKNGRHFLPGLDLGVTLFKGV